MKKYKFSVMALALSAIIFTFFRCNNNDTENDIYENHDVSVCGVNDPLQNIEWLKEYCKSLNNAQYFSKVHIYLYKVVGTDEHVFQTGIAYLKDSPVPYSGTWRNCAGDLIFHVESGVPPNPEVVEFFLKDKGVCRRTISSC